MLFRCTAGQLTCEHPGASLIAAFSLTIGLLGLQFHAMMPGFYEDSVDLISGPDPCKATTLPTTLSNLPSLTTVQFLKAIFW